MGVRLALGATPRATATLLLRTGLAPLAVGIGTGLAGAALASRLMQSMLYRVNSFDLTTLAAAVATLLAVTLAAGLIPARRIARVDPASALRL
jgi:ABC-type antimicrobial peptide transport system permease subunit